jgi:hypothetical protein
MTRRLRIAVSVFFAVLTVLVCVLWVRSYLWSWWIYSREGNKGTFWFSKKYSVRCSQSDIDIHHLDLMFAQHGLELDLVS